MADAWEPIRARIVEAYDRMSLEQWARFSAYCDAKGSVTSLESFVDFLLEQLGDRT